MHAQQLRPPRDLEGVGLLRQPHHEPRWSDRALSREADQAAAALAVGARGHDLHWRIELAHHGVEGLFRLAVRPDQGCSRAVLLAAFGDGVAAPQVAVLAEEHLRQGQRHRRRESDPAEDARSEVASDQGWGDGQAQLVDQTLAGEVTVEGGPAFAQEHLDPAPAQLGQGVGKVDVARTGLHHVGDGGGIGEAVGSDVGGADDRGPRFGERGRGQVEFEGAVTTTIVGWACWPRAIRRACRSSLSRAGP